MSAPAQARAQVAQARRERRRETVPSANLAARRARQARRAVNLAARPSAGGRA